MVLPVLRAFFYTRPIRLSPLDNGLWILLTGLGFGLLATEAHPLENVPDTGWVVINPQLLFNYICNPSKRPQFGRIAVVTRAFQQQLFQPFYLLFR